MKTIRKFFFYRMEIIWKPSSFGEWCQCLMSKKLCAIQVNRFVQVEKVLAALNGDRDVDVDKTGKGM